MIIINVFVFPGLTQLQSMFPNCERETIKQAFESASHSLSAAADSLLMSSGKRKS